MLQEIFAHLGFDFDSENAKKAEHATHSLAHQFEQLIQIAKQVGPALGVFEVGHKIFEMTEGFVNGVRELSNFSQQIGISAQQLQIWRFAAKLADVEAADFDLGLRKLSVGIVEAAQGSKEFVPLFAKMGVQVKDSAGKVGTLEDLLPEIVEGFNNIPEGVEQTAAAVQLFGRSGTRLIPLLQKGKEGLAELSAEFGELGDVLSEKTLRETEEFEDTGKKLALVFKTLKDRLVMWLVPALTTLGGWIEKGLKAFKEFDKDTQILENSMKILGLFLVVILIPALWTAVTAVYALLAPFIAVAAAVAAAFLVLEDLYTLFSGGDSEIGERLDQWFGAGTVKKILAWRDSVIKAFKDFVAAFVKTFLEWEAATEKFFAQLNKYLAEVTWAKFWEDAKAAGQAFLDWVLDIPTKLLKAFGVVGDAVKKLFPSLGGKDVGPPIPRPRKLQNDAIPPKPEELISGAPMPAPREIGGAEVGTVEQIQNLLGNVQASTVPKRSPAPIASTSKNSTETTVNIGPTNLNIQTAPNTPTKQVAETAKVIEKVVDNRNRQALQALEFAK